MSNNNVGYGTDIKYKLNKDGTIDLEIGDSGDLVVVGGSTNEAMSIKRQNAIQAIILRIITPKGSLTDQNDEVIGFGSNLYDMIGNKNTDINRLAVKAYVMSCLQDYEAIEIIYDIGVTFTLEVISIKLVLKLKDDSEIITETVEVGS